MTPLARKEPDFLIIHVGTNNIHTERPTELVDKLMKLHKFVLSISPSAKVVLSNIISRHDFKKEQLSKKISEVNTMLSIECKKKNIYLLDNINVTGIGKKGIHLNNKSKEQIAGNLLEYISSI